MKPLKPRGDGTALPEHLARFDPARHGLPEVAPRSGDVDRAFEVYDAVCEHYRARADWARAHLGLGDAASLRWAREDRSGSEYLTTGRVGEQPC
ncbi:hypothetical protein Acsp06_41490 [Actinomycetospora sp. NBRC 106375]|uniref:hypothetical protein n=1 Tax=Actinomycetospora sp. NBRC 106375 TaxID=3032207 RepID=UPI0024A4B316|nr:hypothetical protein [Actinomycetospora sp. NBRC 106375]GLZ47964.1 hypothetical protein Acsp06_41490 [Actinomycetospora sp. NBRC 106375]